MIGRSCSIAGGVALHEQLQIGVRRQQARRDAGLLGAQAQHRLQQLDDAGRRRAAAAAAAAAATPPSASRARARCAARRRRRGVRARASARRASRAAPPTSSAPCARSRPALRRATIAGARLVALARELLAPRRQLAQHDQAPRAQRAAAAHAQPGVVRLDGRLRTERSRRRHSSRSHSQRCKLVEARAQLLVHRQQVAHVVDGVGELRLGERPARPIGERLALFHRHAEQPLDELGVADLRAVAGQSPPPPACR